MNKHQIHCIQPTTSLPDEDDTRKTLSKDWTFALGLKKNMPNFSAHSLIPHYKWSVGEIKRDSPSPLPTTKAAQNLALLNLYKDNELLVAADDWKIESRSVGEWKNIIVTGRPETWPAKIYPWSPLSSANGTSCSHYVVAHLFLSMSYQGTLIKWMVKALPLVLKAVVKTDNGVFQAWFDLASDKVPWLQRCLNVVFGIGAPILDCRNVADMPSQEVSLIFLDDTSADGGARHE